MEGIVKVFCPHLLEAAVSGFHCKLTTDLCLFSSVLWYEWFSCANGRTAAGRRICCVYSTAVLANSYYSGQFYIPLMPLFLLFPESEMFFILGPRTSMTFFWLLFLLLNLQLWHEESQMPSLPCSLNGCAFFPSMCLHTLTSRYWETGGYTYNNLITCLAHLGIFKWVRIV